LFLVRFPIIRWVASLAVNCKKYHLGDFSDEAAAAAHYDLAKKAHDEGTLADFLAAQKAAKDAHKQAAAKEKPAAAAAAAAAAAVAAAAATQPDLEGQPLLALATEPFTAAPTAAPLNDTVPTTHTLVAEEHQDGAESTTPLEI